MSKSLRPCWGLEWQNRGRRGDRRYARAGDRLALAVGVRLLGSFGIDGLDAPAHHACGASSLEVQGTLGAVNVFRPVRRKRATDLTDAEIIFRAILMSLLVRRTR